MTELREMFQVGNKVRQKTVSNSKGRLLHVLAIVDENQVVYKYWSYSWKEWVYLISSFGYFEPYFDSGWMEVVK